MSGAVFHIWPWIEGFFHVLRPSLIGPRVRAKTLTSPSEIRAKTLTLTSSKTNRRFTSSRSDEPYGNKIKESKAPEQRRLRRRNAGHAPLSLNARLYGPVLAIKGTASPRFAPLGFLWSPGAFDLMHR